MNLPLKVKIGLIALALEREATRAEGKPDEYSKGYASGIRLAVHLLETEAGK